MRYTIFLVLLPCFLVPSQASGQSTPDGAPKSRFSAELKELLLATSSGYEIDGKAITPAMGTASIAKATQSNDPRIQELGRLYAELFSLYTILRQQKLDPTLEQLSRKTLDALEDECLKVIQARVPPTEQKDFELRKQFIKQIVDQGRKEGYFAPETKPNLPQVLEKFDVNKQLEKTMESSLLSTVVLLIGQAKGLEAKDKIQRMVGQPVGAPPSAPEPLKVKLETNKDKQVVMAVTNQSQVALHDCLFLARAMADPKLVDRKTRMQLATLGLMGGAFGAEEKQQFGMSDKFKDKRITYIFLQSILYNMDRGGLVFVPVLPAGSTVRIGLIALDDMPFLQRSEVSLWCNELTLEGLHSGTKPGLPPVLLGTPLTLNARGTLVHKSELSKKDVRDPQSTPGTTKVCKVFSVPLDAGRTYAIEATADQVGVRVFDPPTVRVENELGDVLPTTREKSPANSYRILFVPPEKASYRIFCTEGFHGIVQGSGKFTLSIMTRGAVPPGSGTPGKEKAGTSSLITIVDDMEYTYLGTTRSGKELFVTIAAKSKRGTQQVSLGQMILVDPEGKQYTAAPRSGMGATFTTQEGKAVNLVWRFGPNILTGQGSAPSEKLQRFASVQVELMRPPGNFTLHDVPTVIRGNRK
ncbi:MAG TPA: hypothetical protein PLX97_04200 [Gemmatales bacterium]|nr:hypothetical protein [Gemmatales bacterium]